MEETYLKLSYAEVMELNNLKGDLHAAEYKKEYYLAVGNLQQFEYWKKQERDLFNAIEEFKDKKIVKERSVVY